MLLQASFDNREGSKDLFESTMGVLFLGTPHSGSSFAEKGDRLRGIMEAAGFDTAKQNLRDLAPDSTMLEQCRLNFQTLHRRENFKVYIFQEALGMTGIRIAKANDKVCRRPLYVLDN